MQRVKVSLLPSVQQNDLTIIYKEGNNQLHELKTPYNELLKSLRYFQHRTKEIELTKLVYLQEEIPFNIFSEFISSVNTKEIYLDENNFEAYYKLSCKYEYHELKMKIEEFMNKRPDLSFLVDQLSTSSKPNATENNDNDLFKEEILSKNLDVVLQNNLLKKLPIETIIRVLNSPKRVLKNHHLLFQFVISEMKKLPSEKMNNNNNRMIYEILPSSLDYNLMTRYEIVELLEIGNQLNFFSPKNSNEVMKTIIQTMDEMNVKFSAIEKVVESQAIEIENLKKRLELTESSNKKIESREEENKNIIENLLEKNKKNEAKISQVEERSDSMNSEQSVQFKTLNERISKVENELKILNEHKTKISKIEENLSVIKDSKNTIECNDGVFNYLFKKYGTNPVTKGMIGITGNSRDYNEQKLLPKIIDSNWNTSHWLSSNDANSYVNIDFKNSLVSINKYRLRVGNAKNGGGFFTSWVLTGITEKNSEIVLDEVKNSSEVSESHPEALIYIQNHTFVKSIKLIVKEKRLGCDYNIVLRNIELFGKLKLD